jgi:hypothetical protein
LISFEFKIPDLLMGIANGSHAECTSTLHLKFLVVINLRVDGSHIILRFKTCFIRRLADDAGHSRCFELGEMRLGGKRFVPVGKRFGHFPTELRKLGIPLYFEDAQLRGHIPEV